MIDVDDWDDLVSTTYGKIYNLQQQDGCMERGMIDITIPTISYSGDYDNETVPEEINGNEMGVSFAAWLKRDPAEWNGSAADAPHINLFWSRNFYPALRTVANDLYTKSLIPAGNYSINIDW